MVTSCPSSTPASRRMILSASRASLGGRYRLSLPVELREGRGEAGEGGGGAHGWLRARLGVLENASGNGCCLIVQDCMLVCELVMTWVFFLRTLFPAAK